MDYAEFEGTTTRKCKYFERSSEGDKMISRKGTLLEKDVQRIFNLAGFQTQHQVRINNYEIDVYAKYDNFTVVIECKQYEKSTLNIRNLIHLWDSKNKEIGASKVLLVLFGFDIPESNYQLAEKYSIKLWNHNDVDRFLDLLIEDREKGRKVLFQNLGVEEREIDKLRLETERIKKKARETGKPIDNAMAIKTIVDNGIKSAKLLMDEIETYSEQGIPEEAKEDFKKAVLGIKDIINSVYSSIYCSILASLKSTFLDPRNKDKIPQPELEEFKNFLKKWNKYTTEEEEKKFLSDDYKYFKEEVEEIDKSGKIKNFSKCLKKIEEQIEAEKLIQKVNEFKKEYETFLESKIKHFELKPKILEPKQRLKETLIIIGLIFTGIILLPFLFIGVVPLYFAYKRLKEIRKSNLDW